MVGIMAMSMVKAITRRERISSLICLIERDGGDITRLVRIVFISTALLTLLGSEALLLAVDYEEGEGRAQGPEIEREEDEETAEEDDEPNEVTAQIAA
jgi:hypothetical protein